MFQRIFPQSTTFQVLRHIQKLVRFQLLPPALYGLSCCIMSSISPSVKSKVSTESKVCKRQANALYHSIILFAETKIFESGFFKSELTAFDSKWWRIILNVRTNDTKGWNLLDGNFLYRKTGHPSGEEMMHFQQQSLKNCLIVGLSGDHWDLGTLIQVESNCILIPSLISKSLLKKDPMCVLNWNATKWLFRDEVPRQANVGSYLILVSVVLGP